MKSQRERITKVGAVTVLVLFILCIVAFVMRHKYKKPEIVVATVFSVKDICFNGNCFQEVDFQKRGRYKITVPKSEALVEGERIKLSMRCPPRGTICTFKYKGREFSDK